MLVLYPNLTAQYIYLIASITESIFPPKTKIIPLLDDLNAFPFLLSSAGKYFRFQTTIYSQQTACLRVK